MKPRITALHAWPRARCPQALKASSTSRSDLERELFGSSTSSAQQQQLVEPDIRACTAQVRAARSWPEARDAIEQAQRAGVDGAFLGACFAALPKLQRGANSTTTTTASSAASTSNSRQHHNPYHLSRGGAAAAEQERQELGAAVQALVEQHVVPLARRQQLDAAQLVSCAVGLAKLGHRDAAAYEALVLASVPHMGEGLRMPEGLINMVWALATVGVRPPGAWLTGFWDELGRRSDALSGTDLATVCW